MAARHRIRHFERRRLTTFLDAAPRMMVRVQDGDVHSN
jgi:hypothetical protein